MPERCCVKSMGAAEPSGALPSSRPSIVPALPGQLLIDGLCVERDHRGRGIGSCLIGGVLEIARQRGFATVRLEVTNGNLRAQALYARHGFVATDSTAIGWAAPLVGFGKYTTMIRKV